MPGPGDELKAGLRDEISDELAQSLNFDRLVATSGPRRAVRGAVQKAIGERFIERTPSPKLKQPSRILHRLDINAFHGDLLARLSGQCNGFVYRLLEPGGPGLTVQSGMARNPADGDVGWTPDVRMHVASVSKLITAMAATKALADAGVPGKTAIYPWLPLYWQPRGPGIDTVTFDMLMRHESGLWTPLTDDIDFGEMKAQIYRGTILDVPLGDEQYQNVNFSLLRILIPVLTGAIKVSLTSPSGSEEETDRLWDVLTVQAYGDYVRAHVLEPAQVIDARTASEPGYAMAYRWPMVGAGWDSGDLSPYSATIAWHLSANELVRVLQGFLDGRVVPKKRAHRMLEAQWGIDQIHPTPAGPCFLKGGRWESGANQLAQAVAGILPGGLPFALLMNSQHGTDRPFLMDVVAATVLRHVVRDV